MNNYYLFVIIIIILIVAALIIGFVKRIIAIEKELSSNFHIKRTPLYKLKPKNKVEDGTQ